jgi:hypothetical protein
MVMDHLKFMLTNFVIIVKVASLQMKIVAEDKAVETRTNDFLNDWERSKPVEGHLRPDEALQHLQMYESKFARLKEERDNVAKAKEALELQEPGKIVTYSIGSHNQVHTGVRHIKYTVKPCEDIFENSKKI